MVAEIIRNKPIPNLKRRGAVPKYPWLKLQPGEAFRFDKDVTFAGARSMASQHHAGETAKWKFVVRECDDGIWCWRVDGTAHELQNGNKHQEADRIMLNPADKPATRSMLVSDRPQTEDDVI